MPFGEGRHWATSGWKSALFGGWQFNGIFTAMSGTPIYMIQNTGFNVHSTRRRPVARVQADGGLPVRW